MSDDALPLCACEQYYDSHHPECPARRAYEGALNRLDLINRMRINLPEKFWHAELTAILAGERDETAGVIERPEPLISA